MAADLKISEITDAPALIGTERVPVQLGAANYAATTQDIANLARLAPASITDSGNTDLTRAAHFNRLVICANASPITLGYALDSVGLTSEADDLFVRNDGPGTVTIQGAAISPGTVIGLDGTSTVLVPVNTIVGFQRTAADTLRQVDRTLASTGQATAGTDNSTLMTPYLTALAIEQSTPVEPTPTGNSLLSGGGVAFTSALSLIVSAATYQIQGVGYDSLETPLTAATADATNPRIDVVAVDSNGDAILITGTPASNPVKPDVDPETQLELTFFLVAAGATVLPVSVTDIYHENTEWTTSRSGTSFTLASTNNPRAGTVCVEGTAVPTNDHWQATGPGDIDLADHDNLVFYIRSKATWVATRSLSITARKGNTQKGSIVTFKHGTFAFDSSNTSAYQQIVIPLSLFGANGLAVDRFRFASAGTGTALGCYMDDVTLQGGLSNTTDASRMKWRGAYSAALLYQVNDTVLSSGTQYVCIQAGSGQTPASSPTYWQASTGAGGAGTVTSVSVTTANGVSGSVATATTTPAISLTLGAIAPTSVNSVVVSGSSTPTLAVTGTTSVSGTNTGDQLTFKTISVSGQSDVVADTATDTLTLVAGTNVTITTNAGSDSITIAASGGGGGASLSTANTWTATQSTANVDLTDSSNITPNGAAGNSFYLLTTSAVGATRNIALPSGTLVPGTAYNFEVKQPASGGPCAVVFASGYKWGLGGAAAQPTGATTASASDLYGGIVQEDGNIHMSMVGSSGPAGANGANGAGAYTAGRLTLTTGVPVTTSDVTAATTVYFTPYKGNQIQLWDGAAWTAYTFAETSLALGTLTSGKNYDVFGYQSSGTLTLEMLVWTNDTTRATAVTLQDGRYCKSGDKTRLYLGTFRTTSTTTTEDSGGGTTTQVGGKRFLWNYYNRVERYLQVKDTTDNWSYTTNTVRQANNASGNKVEVLVGIAEDIVQASVNATTYLGSSTQGAKAGVGVNSTSALSGLVAGGFQGGASFVYSPFCSNWRGVLAAGYNYLAWVEEGSGAGTCLFLGDNGDEIQSGLYAVVQA